MKPLNDLANRRFRPLSHLSAAGPETDGQGERCERSRSERSARTDDSPPPPPSQGCRPHALPRVAGHRVGEHVAVFAASRFFGRPPAASE